MSETTFEKQAATLSSILESDASTQMFSGETVAQMLNQLLSGHSAESVASKHVAETKPPCAPL